MNMYGLTGAIGSGKSTVARFLRELQGPSVLDTDACAKRVMQGSRAQSVLEALFGPSVFQDDTVNFQRIAEIIFRDKEKKRQLEAYVHPLVWDMVVQKRAQLQDAQYLVVESALIYETQLESLFDGVIVTTCSREEQFRRLMKHRHMSKEDIERRCKEQMNPAEKVAHGDFIIDTECSLELLQERVHALHSKLKGGYQ